MIWLKTLLFLALIELISLATTHKNAVALPQYLPIEAEFCLESGACLSLEVADTYEEQYKGLMKRASMPKGEGMWFKYTAPQIPYFWMLNTLIPLDIIFINKNRIVAIEENVPPCTKKICPFYGPLSLVDGAIEVSAGEVQRLNMKVGDNLAIRYLEESIED